MLRRRTSCNEARAVYLMRMRNHFSYSIPVLAFVVLADFLTKSLVMERIETGHIEVLPFFNLVLVWNRGISFGIFGAGGAVPPAVLIAVSLGIAAFFAFWLRRTEDRPLACALAAVIGGALGNIIDRIQFGAVVDFLDFHAFGWHWPAFNVADSAIVLGIAYAVADGLLFEPKRQKPKRKAKSRGRS